MSWYFVAFLMFLVYSKPWQLASYVLEVTFERECLVLELYEVKNTSSILY